MDTSTMNRLMRIVIHLIFFGLIFCSHANAQGDGQQLYKRVKTPDGGRVRVPVDNNGNPLKPNNVGDMMTEARGNPGQRMSMSAENSFSSTTTGEAITVVAEGGQVVALGAAAAEGATLTEILAAAGAITAAVTTPVVVLKTIGTGSNGGHPATTTVYHPAGDFWVMDDNSDSKAIFHDGWVGINVPLGSGRGATLLEAEEAQSFEINGSLKTDKLLSESLEFNTTSFALKNPVKTNACLLSNEAGNKLGVNFSETLPLATVLDVEGKAYFYPEGRASDVKEKWEDEYNMRIGKGLMTQDIVLNNTHGWADYVFKEEYQLRSLEEVEEHIRTRGHLPEIPSQQDIEKQGYYDLHSTTMLLLKKTEELTLYTIEKQKKLNELMKRLQEAKKQQEALQNN